MKKIKIIIIILVLIILTLFLFKNTITKFVVINGVKFITGLTLDIEEIDLKIFNTIIDIKGMRIYNPENYPEIVMIDMPRIYIDYNLKPLIKGDIHLNSLKIDLKKLIVIKNKQGELNLESLKFVKDPKKPETKKDRDFKIDLLELKVDKVLYKDYTQADKPRIREFNVNIDTKHTNITDPYGLASLIIVQALTRTTIANIANFDLTGLTKLAADALGKTLDIATGTIKGVTEITKETIKKILPFID